jgi:hypothetical protein
MAKPKIVFIPDKKRHHSDPDPRTGTVQVTYGNGTVRHFGAIARDQFFRWHTDKFKSRYKPLGVTVDWEEDDDDSIPEVEAEDSAIRADDYIGQQTGIPSHGYGPIRDDDHLGQETGRPTPGFEPDEGE